jgi:hypothetical protein
VYLPEGAPTNTQVSITAPGGGGVSIRRPLEKTGEAGVYKVDYPLKPGETTFEMVYTMPSTGTFTGRWLHRDAPFRLITPGTVTVSGDALRLLGQEPQTQARIYEITQRAFEVKVEGAGAIPGMDSGGSGETEEDTGQPQLQRVPARVYSRLGWVLGLSLAILGLGGALLYRKGVA